MVGGREVELKRMKYEPSPTVIINFFKLLVGRFVESREKSREIYDTENCYEPRGKAKNTNNLSLRFVPSRLKKKRGVGKVCFRKGEVGEGDTHHTRKGVA